MVNRVCCLQWKRTRDVLKESSRRIVLRTHGLLLASVTIGVSCFCKLGEKKDEDENREAMEKRPRAHIFSQHATPFESESTFIFWFHASANTAEKVGLFI